MNTSSGEQRGGVPDDRDGFMTTRWSLVLRAGDAASPEATRALGELCQAYWYPLYAYARRRGLGREDAEDRVQSLFESLLEHQSLGRVRSDRGRFRAFLLACLKHGLAGERERAARGKRGGGVPLLSLDWQDAAQRFHREPVDVSNPEQAYDRAWALALLERVVLRLRRECEDSGRGPLFQQAREFLVSGESRLPQAQAAGCLGMEEGAFRVAVHRLRRRYRDLLRAEIAQTVSDPDLIEEELRSLHAALAPPG